MGFLDQVITGRRMAPPRIVIYGPGGVGKTSWAASSPTPLLIPTEDGRGTLEVPAVPLVKSMQEMGQVLTEIRDSEHAYKTLILDSLDHLEPLIWRYCVEQANKPAIKSIEDFGYGKGYVEALGSWRKVLGLLSEIREKKGMAIILIAHHEIKAFQDPTSEPYDRYQIKLHKSAAGLVQEWADAVLFATYEVHAIKGETDKVRGMGEGKRRLLCEERPTHVAKNRWGLPYELPMPIDNPFAPFAAALKAATTQGDSK